MYSGAFARLAEITQVTSPEKGYAFHNRLTHSLKVGQIARRIAEKLQHEDPALVEELGGIDVDAAETAGLAHDLGHPPFGHIAEQELDSLVRQAGVSDGYEGNAQSLRIVARLAVSDARTPDAKVIQGLNLTRRSLDAILKYPWGRCENPRNPEKWGYYQTEKDIFNWVREERPRFQRSLTAEIMDWADDITFAIHDLTDFYRAGRIPIDRCQGDASAERKRLARGMFARKSKWRSSRGAYMEALSRVIGEFRFNPDEMYTGSVEHQARLFDFSTSLIRSFVGSIHLRPPSRPLKSFVKIDPEAKRNVEVLKQFIWEYVIDNPGLAVPQQGQRLAIRTVFRCLLRASLRGEWHLFPPPYSTPINRIARPEAVRLVSDCVSGMTEREILAFFRALRGTANSQN